MNIAVIGGGITGLSAPFMLPGVSSIKIYEASKNLGGILRDCEYPGYNFYAGCQYFNGNSDWFDRMGLSKSFFEFSHRYGSYTDIFGSTIFSNFFAGPVCQSNDLKIGAPRSVGWSSVSDRLSCYPLAIQTKLEAWFQRTGLKSNQTHVSAINGLQIGRVYLKGRESELKELKKKSSVIDELYGLPRTLLGMPDLKAFLPYDGYSDFFDEKIQLPDNVVKIEKSSVANCVNLDGKLALEVKGQLSTPDYVIWTADPTRLLKKLFNEKLDSQRFFVELLVGFLDKSILDPFYIQVFSESSKVLRIFCYNSRGKGCVTIEKIRDDQPMDDVMKFCNDVLSGFLSQRISSIELKKTSVRFFAHSVDDFGRLCFLRSQTRFDNLIVPSFVDYGRDQKITSVARNSRKSIRF